MLEVILLFQSPRSGQICSNYWLLRALEFKPNFAFQSPRSGQICSNSKWMIWQLDLRRQGFNPLDRVKFVQIA